MRLHNGNLAIWLAAVLVLTLPLALSLYLVNELAVDREIERTSMRALAVLLRAEAVADQAENAFHRLDAWAVWIPAMRAPSAK